MTAHILDRPVWSALNTRQAGVAQGGRLARRYVPGNIPFAATGDESGESLAALEELVLPGERLAILQVDPVKLPPGLEAVLIAPVVQMVAGRPMPPVSDARIESLTEADAPEMLALAELTRPGPFSLRSISLGEFWGIRRDGRLIAMAGERMKQEGMTELSGVCTHPDARGQGLGRLLSIFMAGGIAGRGEQAFLHAYATNTVAIGLYESIGFTLRSTLNVAMVQRR